jgi:hypothetical protein
MTICPRAATRPPEASWTSFLGCCVSTTDDGYSLSHAESGLRRLERAGQLAIPGRPKHRLGASGG